jgi:hypothetical protein
MDKAKLNRLIKKEAKSCAAHFKKDKWTLDYHLIYSQLVTDYLGVDITAKFWTELEKSGLVVLPNGNRGWEVLKKKDASKFWKSVIKSNFRPKMKKLKVKK